MKPKQMTFEENLEFLYFFKRLNVGSILEVPSCVYSYRIYFNIFGRSGNTCAGTQLYCFLSF